MSLKKNLNLRRYIVMNIVLAALFLNALFFAPLLKAGEAFTAGLVTGIGAGWIIFAIAGWIVLKRPGQTIDERLAAAFTKACAFAFWVVIMTASVLQILLRAEILSIVLDAKECAALIGNLGLASLVVAYIVAAKTS